MSEETAKMSYNPWEEWFNDELLRIKSEEDERIRRQREEISDSFKYF